MSGLPAGFWPAIARASAHPLQIRILIVAAAAEVVSPKALASDLEADLTTVAYHVRQLEKLGLLRELEDRQEQRRGATAHFYELAIAGGGQE